MPLFRNKRNLRDAPRKALADQHNRVEIFKYTTNTQRKRTRNGKIKKNERGTPW
jgi:hypothetical protein